MSAAEAPFIPRRPKDFGPYSFWGLRAQGLAALQSLSGARWTDYNLHDPGVTILEQTSYALTDLVYRADAPVADQLAGPQGQIDFEALALHPAESVFPCRPATADDYRRMLLDRIEELADAQLAPAPDGPAGMWHVQLRVAATRQHRKDDVIRQAVAMLRSHRNLGEDFMHEPMLVREQGCELEGEIEVGGPNDPADVAAAIYAQCAWIVEAPTRFSSLTAMQADGIALEDIFDGPPVRHGHLQANDDEDPGDPVFVSELVAAIRAVPGVVQVKELALRAIGEAHAQSSLPRRGPGWALRLVLPGEGEQGTTLRLTRRGAVLQPAMKTVRRKYAERRVAVRQHEHQADGTGFMPARPVARAPVDGPYCAIQEQFPPTYGINTFGLPPGASVREKASALQLKAYLVLFDQVLAHSASQLAHARELFTVDPAERRTYWWQMLDDRAIPGIETQLYASPASQIEQRVYRPLDDFIERKSRLLDYLLALHGETYSQNSLRQFGGYYTARELNTLLFENKLAFLTHVIALGRDRAAAFDDTHPCWGSGYNMSGLQRRVALLLGFTDGRTRALTDAIRQRELHLAPAHDTRIEDEPAPPQGARRIALPANTRTPGEVDSDLDAIAPLAQRRLDESLLRCGAHADRYWVIDEGGGGVVLSCGPDESGRWHTLGRFDEEAAATRSAAALRQVLLHLNESSEGLHVIEHVLLAPAGASAAHDQLRQQVGKAIDFSRLRVSVMFPAWPQRCRDANFRALAEETVNINCPAHLEPRCFWLGLAEMHEFEKQYEKWLAARLVWFSGPDEEQARVRMNHCATALLRILLLAVEASS